MRKRRRTKYTWLPNFGHPIGDPGQNNTYLSQFVLDLPPVGQNQPIVGIVPILFDISGPIGQENAGIFTTMADLIGSEYFVKRIVGKCFLDVNYQNQTGATIGVSSFPPVTVAAGFFIAREDPGNLETPIQSNIPFNYSGFEPENQREPWLWQRQWMLGPGWQPPPGGPGDGVANNQGVDVGAIWGGNQSWPLNNYAGSVLDGPHIDCKTARRVRQDERLWFQASACTATPAIDIDPNPVQVNVRLYARVLGALRRARGKSSF